MQSQRNPANNRDPASASGKTGPAAGGVVFVCGAFPPEIDQLQLELAGRAVPERLRRPGGSVALDLRYEVAALGIGSLAAALALERRIASSASGAAPPVREVVFLGSAGIYKLRFPPGAAPDPSLEPQVGEVGFAQSFTKRDIVCLSAEDRGRAKQPGELGRPLLCTAGPCGLALADAAPQARPGLCNSTDSVTLADVTIDADDERFLEDGAPGGDDAVYSTPRFENLEGAGLARVALDYDLPFATLLALTNSTGPDGSREWEANFREASLALQKRALQVLL